MPAQTVIKIRRDTSTNWDAVNPTLAAGEIAFETDTNKIKVGDGSTVWASLDYASGAGTAAEIGYDNVDAELIATTVKGALDELSLTKADVSQLSTNLAVFATTAASDISGYNVLVSSIDNPDYNTTAANVPTGAINADGQLIASLASDAGLFEGQVDPITVTTLGNIRKTAGNANQSASFYFEVYVRNAAGTETLVGTSDDTGEVNPTNLNEYQEFSASAFVNFGTVGATDRIVLKFYGNVTDGAGAEYDFQFGGGNPVRTLIPVPAIVAVAQIASSVEVDTTNFDGVLSGSDTTVQAALETLDDLDISAGVITSDSPPSAPSNGDLWWESDTGILYIYYDNFWVEAVAGIVGPQGDTGAVVSDTEPANQSVLWVDTSEGGSTIMPITTQGDLVIGDASGDPVRLPVGSADQVLTSDGTTVSFQDAAEGGGIYGNLIASGSIGGNFSIQIIPNTYKDLRLVLKNLAVFASGNPYLRINNDLQSNYFYVGIKASSASIQGDVEHNHFPIAFEVTSEGYVVVDIFGYQGNTGYKTLSAFAANADPTASSNETSFVTGGWTSSGDIDEIAVFGGLNGGSYELYGVN